jgi:hypothetical protein
MAIRSVGYGLTSAASSQNVQVFVVDSEAFIDFTIISVSLFPGLDGCRRSLYHEIHLMSER